MYALPCPQNLCTDVWKINGTWRKGPWSFHHFLNSLSKAKFSGYSSFVVSEIALALAEFPEMILQIKIAGLLPVLQVSSADSILRAQELLKGEPLVFEFWIVHAWPEWSLLRDLKKQQGLLIKILGVRDNPCLQQIEQIPEDFLEAVEFYFPYSVDKKRKWRARDIMVWQEHITKLRPQLRFRGCVGTDLYEPRIPEERELEPCHAPLWSSHPQLIPKVSVIIPTYNNGLYLLNTLRHLNQQQLPHEHYEVIVVDDGSHDKMSEGLTDLIRDFQMPVQLLYFPRMRQRKMGDSQFRAGLARNYGVKFARAEVLVFLDSDILTPPDFLQKTLELNKVHDVVQWRREYFHERVSCHSIRYQNVCKEKDIFIPERGYWHGFYEESQKKGWTHLEHHWKYACTYAFALKKSLFKDVGWFRKTFCFYGLEDTDLGWRLAQRGCSFYLEQTPVYHLFHETARSEFFNSAYKRQKLLKSTAEIFFYNNLSPDIYRVFQYLFNSWIF